MAKYKKYKYNTQALYFCCIVQNTLAKTCTFHAQAKQMKQTLEIIEI
jgi:hypothetical protein